MSSFLVGDKGETVRDLFYMRSAYTVITSAPLSSPVTDFYIAEKQLYGKVNFDYIPILPKGPHSSVPFRAYKAFNARYQKNTVTPFQAPAYVVDAFEAMAGAFDRAVISGQIPRGHKYLSQLKVHDAHHDFIPRYTEYLRNYIIGTASALHKMKAPIKNMTQLVQFYEAYMVSGLSTAYPLTLSSFIKGPQCSRLHTGLSIEIADLTSSNDQEKYTHFLSAPAWQFYVNAAREYGFMIDRHIPWRLVADIGSEAFLQYSKKYGMNSTGKILDLAFRPAHELGFIKFMQFFVMLYENTVTSSLEVPQLCPDGKIRYRSVKPKKYTLMKMLEEIPEGNFLRLYMNVRMQEEVTPFTPDQQHILMRECMGLYEIASDRSLTLEVFARIVNKTFDYAGSLSYIIERRKQLESANTTKGVGGAASSFNNSSPMDITSG